MRHKGTIRAAPPNCYARSQVLVHWVSAILVVVLIPMGVYMVGRYAATSNDAVTMAIYDIHKFLGFATFWLAVLRVTLRNWLGAPTLSSVLPHWQRTIAVAVHFVLYTLLAIVPLLGWIGASADGMASMFGGFQLPGIVPKNEEIGWRILWVHGWAAFTLGALVTVHLVAALHHQFVRKDDIMRRIL